VSARAPELARELARELAPVQEPARAPELELAPRRVPEQN
jgi:hypothetical protein